MRSDNATQNAMQWKCIALRRFAARKLPLLPPYGRRNQESLNCYFNAFILLVWSQYVVKLTPFWGVLLVFIGRSCCLHFGCFCRQIHEEHELAFKLLLQSLQLLLQSLH